jgi:hypothetical protein
VSTAYSPGDTDVLGGERLTGSPVATIPIPVDWAEDPDVRRKFYSRVKLVYVTGCLIWHGAENPGGYGRFTINGTRYLAHRLAWVDYHQRDVPPGMTLDHLCRNVWCVNADHLEPVTHRVNVLRGESPSAVNATKTHCYNGHELSADNLVPSALEYGYGYRHCWTCSRRKDRERRALITAAQRHCGMQQREYVAVYGERQRVARFVLAIVPRPNPTTNQLEF